MLTEEWVLTIPGTPAPKGSLKCIGARGRHQLIEDNPETKVWRSTIAGWATRALAAGKITPAVKGQPLGAEITTTLEDLKKRRPYAVTRSSYDVDKLLRLVLDALQDAKAIPDDAQIVEVVGRKTYPNGPLPDALPWPGVRIRLYPIGD